MIIKPDTIIGGRYTIESLIATGGMGQVWMANDSVLDRRVAIKILKAEFSADRNFLTRFREEARTTARLNHPNIVSVYDYGEFQDTDGGDPIAYLVMELVHAESLSHALGRLTTLTVAQTLDMLSQTAQGLSAAHEEGIIHRDVKPGNILITPRGRVKISDFGIAKAVDSVPITRTGTVMGTAQYISPEQAVGKDATSASDIYSLGIVGYEALCGKRPFDGEGSVSAAMAHVTASPNPLPNSIPANVRDLIAIALRKDPAARYKDGAEFARAVSQVQAGNPAPLPESVLDNGPVGASTGGDLDLPTSMQPTERIGMPGGAGRAAGMGIAGAAGAAGAVAGAAGAARAAGAAGMAANSPQFSNAPTEMMGQPGGGLVTGSNVQRADGQYVVPSSALPYNNGYTNIPNGQPGQPGQPGNGTGGVPIQGGPYPSSAPRKTSAEEEPRGLGAGQVILIVLGVLLVIALIAYGAYTFLGKTDLPTNQPSEQPTVTLTQTLTNSPEESETEEPPSAPIPTVEMTEEEDSSSPDSESTTKKTKTSKTRHSKTKTSKSSHSSTEPSGSSSSSSSDDNGSSTSASSTEPTGTTDASTTVKPSSTTTTEHPQEP